MSHTVISPWHFPQVAPCSWDLLASPSGCHFQAGRLALAQAVEGLTQSLMVLLENKNSERVSSCREDFHKKHFNKFSMERQLLGVHCSSLDQCYDAIKMEENGYLLCLSSSGMEAKPLSTQEKTSPQVQHSCYLQLCICPFP